MIYGVLGTDLSCAEGALINGDNGSARSSASNVWYRELMETGDGDSPKSRGQSRHQ